MIEWQWFLIDEVKLVPLNENLYVHNIQDQQYLQNIIINCEK